MRIAKLPVFLRSLEADLSTPNRSIISTKQSPSEFLIESFLVALTVERRLVLHQVYYLFRVLEIGDYATLLFGKSVNKGQTFAELGFILHRRTKRVGTLQSSETQKDKEKAKLERMVKRGLNLHMFCEKIGTGALFWLHTPLSDHL